MTEGQRDIMERHNDFLERQIIGGKKRQEDRMRKNRSERIGVRESESEEEAEKNRSEEDRMRKNWSENRSERIGVKRIGRELE